MNSSTKHENGIAQIIDPKSSQSDLEEMNQEASGNSFDSDVSDDHKLFSEENKQSRHSFLSSDESSFESEREVKKRKTSVENGDFSLKPEISISDAEEPVSEESPKKYDKELSVKLCDFITCCDCKKTNFRDLKYIKAFRNKRIQKEMTNNLSSSQISCEVAEVENDFNLKHTRIKETCVDSSCSDSEQGQEDNGCKRAARTKNMYEENSNDESEQENKKSRNNHDTSIKSITVDSSDVESEQEQQKVMRKRNLKKESSVDILDSESENEQERGRRKRAARKRNMYKESSNDESESEKEKVLRNRAARKKIKYKESSNDDSEQELKRVRKRDTRIKSISVDSDSEKEEKNVIKKRVARIKSVPVDSSEVESEPEQEKESKENTASTKNLLRESSNEENQPQQRKLVIKINARMKSSFVDNSDDKSEEEQQKKRKKSESKEAFIDGSDYESEEEQKKRARKKAAKTNNVYDERSTDVSDQEQKIMSKKRDTIVKNISAHSSDVESELELEKVIKKRGDRIKNVDTDCSNSENEQELKKVRNKRVVKNSSNAICIELSDDDEEVKIVPTRGGRTRGRNINYSEKSLAAKAYAESNSDEKDSDESSSYKEDSDDDDDDYDEEGKNDRKKRKKSAREDEPSDEALSDDIWEEEDVKKKRKKTSKEERKTEKKENKRGKPVSEYEEMRQKNVEDKLAFLKSLQMDEVVADFNEFLADKKPKKPQIKKKIEEFSIERKSKRLENVTMNLSEKDMAEKVYKTIVVPEDKDNKVYLPRNYAFEEAIEDEGYDKFIDKYGDFFKNMETNIVNLETKNTKKKKAVVSNDDNNHFHFDSLDQSSYKTAQLQFHSETLEFHPFAGKTILMASSKFGHVSFWDSATDFNPVAFKPHTDRVTLVKAHPQNPYNIISSSWDGTIRKADLETKCFTLAFRDDIVCKYFDFTSPTDILVAQRSGIITHIDFRLKGSDARHFKCHNSGIRTISVHPTNKFCCVTVDNGGLLKVWDTRYQASYTPVISVEKKSSRSCIFFSSYWKKYSLSFTKSYSPLCQFKNETTRLNRN